MASMKGRSKSLFDAESGITLRDIADGAETATVAEAPISIGALVDAEWDGGEIPWNSFKGVSINVQVSDMDVADADEVYTLNVEVSTDEAFTSNVATVGTLVVPAPGAYVLRLDPEVVRAVATSPRYIRIGLTASGTTPSITYGAWLS